MPRAASADVANVGLCNAVLLGNNANTLAGNANGANIVLAKPRRMVPNPGWGASLSRSISIIVEPSALKKMTGVYAGGIVALVTDNLVNSHRTTE